jgi:hypothetical protein
MQRLAEQETSPLLPSSSPARIASSVDLPEPDSPIRAMVCPV